MQTLHPFRGSGRDVWGEGERLSVCLPLSLVMTCLPVWQVHIPEEQGHAHRFLAQYHLKRKSFAEAEAHAHKCTEFLDVSCSRLSAREVHRSHSPPPLGRFVRRASR